MRKTLLIVLALFLTQLAYAASPDFAVPVAWSPLKPILVARVNQSKLKMKLNKEQALSFVSFLGKLETPLPRLIALEKVLPKTTVELLIAVHERGLALEEAEKMAAYLEWFLRQAKFQNRSAFDENTSHIIGREWQEIDYAGENMTWEKQRSKYFPYGVTNFKTEENLRKFFKLESRLPYFNKIYRPEKNFK